MPDFFNNIWGINVGNLMACIAFCMIILIAVLFKQERPAYTKAYAVFLISLMAGMISEILNYSMAYKPEFRIAFIISNCATFICSTVTVASFLMYLLYYYQYRYGKTIHKYFMRYHVIYGIICILINVTSIWTGLIFTITDSAEYVASRYSYITGLMFIPVVLSTIWVIFKNVKESPMIETCLYLGFVLMFAITGLIDSIMTTTFHFTAMTMFAGLIFILVDIEQQRKLEEKQREILLSELKALRLQMNPHYIYNTLASIDGLILFDPNSARNMIGKIIKHLRGSYLNDMPMLIPVKDEIQNLKYYIDIEQIRFPDIEFEFDIQVDDFDIPPIVIQPLLENAIKHGICGREDSSGKITISVYEEAKNYKIKITDNGVGYDVNAPRVSDGRAHIGINNTKKRLELICQGELAIHSIVGVGTEAEITIPKR